MSYHDCDAVEDTVDCLAAKLERYEAVIAAARALEAGIGSCFAPTSLVGAVVAAVRALDGGDQ